jgi:hypothetical protein
MEINFNDGVFATSFGTGPFHPAIRNGKQLYYWPNITFATESEAHDRACLSLADALQPTIDVVRCWNVYKV